MAVTAFKFYGGLETKLAERAAMKVAPLTVISLALDTVDAGMAVYGYFQECKRTRRVSEAIAERRRNFDLAMEERQKQTEILITLEKKKSMARLENFKKQLLVEQQKIKNQMEIDRSAFYAKLKIQQKKETMFETAMNICEETLKYLGEMSCYMQHNGINNNVVAELDEAYRRCLKEYRQCQNWILGGK